MRLTEMESKVAPTLDKVSVMVVIKRHICRVDLYIELHEFDRVILPFCIFKRKLFY